MNIITKIKKIFVKKPQRILAAGFLFIILIGAILLSLPIATKDFVWTPFIDSLFTSTSAVCVTGLVTVNTAKHWSTFGHLDLKFESLYIYSFNNCFASSII